MASLQRVQNSAVRLMACTGKRQHVTPMLYYLHWFLVIYRLKYKILVYASKALTGTAPRYFEVFVGPYQRNGSLSSDSESLVIISKIQGVTYGNRKALEQSPISHQEI